MAESVQIVCPVCRSKVRLRGSVLSKATVPCPKCETTLDVPKSARPAPPPITAPDRQTPLAISTPARTISEPPKEKPRKRPRPADDIPNPWGDEDSAADDDSDFFGGDQDDFGDDVGGDDPYGSSSALPPRSKQRAVSGAGAAHEAPAHSGPARCGGFISWVGFGALAAIAGIVIQSLLGLTNHMLPLLIVTIATGSLVGYAVRYAAGGNKGWGPGIVAVLIAAFAIFAGRIGAFSLSPDINKFLGVPAAPLTPEEAEARVVKETSEPFLIAGIADEILFDDDAALDAKGIDSEEAYEYWSEHSEEQDPSKRYMPAIWNEAQQRWNKNSPEEKEALRKTRESELREEYGILSEEEVAVQVAEQTTENAMIGRIASTLYYDEEWLTQTGITENQIDEHWENADFDADEDSDIESHHLPVVWTEAKRRWEEFTPEERAAQVREVSDSMREDLAFSAEDAAAAEKVGNVIRILFIIVGAFISFFWSIGSVICSISALVSAFKLGSGTSAGHQ